MVRSGLIIQLARGLYLLPDKLPPGGRWQPPVELAIWHYMQDKQAQWQETGLGAFNVHGLSKQIANVTTVYNDMVSARRRFGTLDVVFIKIGASRLGHFSTIEITAGKPECRKVGTLARVVFDAIYDYTRFNSIPSAYRWIEARKDDEKLITELAHCAVAYGNVSTCRRIGWLLERIGVPESIWGPINLETAVEMGS
jgi:hypothetical protein